MRMGWASVRGCHVPGRGGSLSGAELLYLMVAGVLALLPSTASTVSSAWFGGMGARINMEEIEGFPGSEEFFQRFVKEGIPVLMRGAGQVSPALHLWETDDYFLSLHVPSGEAFDMVVETKKKENRSLPTLAMNFQDFVRSYNNSEYYLVNPVPHFLLRDIVVPGPLQCQKMADAFVENVMWFSSGGTRSVVHTDAVENINCVFSGNKYIVMMDPRQYDEILLDRPEGAYSDVDVDNVDYNKYPGLATAEYYHLNLSAGDCLYIPYKWIHQVRSYGRSIAVNLWWNHYATVNLDLSRCLSDLDPGFTLDKVHFNGFTEMMKSADFLRDQFKDYVKNQKNKKIGLDQLIHILAANFDGDLEEVEDDFIFPALEVINALDTDFSMDIDLDEVKSASDEMWHTVAENIDKFDEILESVEESLEHVKEEL